MRKNNQGLTLIELVVTVAIIAIFSGVVLSIVSTTSNGFRTTSSTAKVQMETQELLDTIQDLVIDANRSVYYSYGASGSSTGTGIENDIDQEAGDAASVRSFYVCNVKEISGFEERCMYDVLRWDPAAQRLTYSYHEYNQQKSDTTGNENNGTQTAAFSDDSLSDGQNDAAAAFLSDDNVAPAAEAESAGESILAENVVSFRADTTKVQSQYIVRFRITLNERGKEITTLHTVNLRNKIKVAPPDQAFPESTPQPVSVKIVEAPTTVRVGEGGRIVAQGFGFSGYESYVWSVDDDSVATIQGNGKEYQLVTKKAGIVTITVTATDRDGRSASASVAITVIEEQKKLDRLEISGLDVVASLHSNTPVYDLRSYIKGYSNNNELDSPGTLVWKCNRDNIISITGDNLSVNSESWNIGGPLGTFELWAESADVPEVMSNKITVSIARIKITNPSNGANFDKNQEVSVEVEYYVGNNKIDHYELYINEQKSESVFTPEAGAYTIRAEGNEKVQVLDSVAINVNHIYQIIGSEVMPKTVAKNGQNDESGYICNKEPVENIDQATGARMYWLADETGCYVQADKWDIIQGNDLITFKAEYQGRQYEKKVNIEDVHIINPSDTTLIAYEGLYYTCEAATTSGNKNYVYSWSAENGIVKGNQLNATGNEVILTVTTDVIMKNSKYECTFPISDSKDYSSKLYKIWGSDVMPDTVAQITDNAALKYICNENPEGVIDAQIGARMYWLGDQNGNFVQAENWSAQFVGGKIIFTASVTVNGTVLTFTKEVIIASVTITEPSDQLLVNGNTYSCSASLTSGGIGSEYIWSTNGETISQNQFTVGTEESVVLKVDTSVKMSNKWFSYYYPVSDNKLFYTVKQSNEVNKWVLEITNVGDKNTGVINVPARLDDSKMTPVKVIIKNPSGNGEHNATGSSRYTWSLYIPALSKTFTNESSGFRFPVKDSGNIIIENWIFPNHVDVGSLPGILTVVCDTSNGDKHLSIKRNVLCVVVD